MVHAQSLRQSACRLPRKCHHTRDRWSGAPVHPRGPRYPDRPDTNSAKTHEDRPAPPPRTRSDISGHAPLGTRIDCGILARPGQAAANNGDERRLMRNNTWLVARTLRATWGIIPMCGAHNRHPVSAATMPTIRCVTQPAHLRWAALRARNCTHSRAIGMGNTSPKQMPESQAWTTVSCSTMCRAKRE